MKNISNSPTYYSPLEDAYLSAIAKYSQAGKLQTHVLGGPDAHFAYELGKEYHPTGKLSIKEKQLGDKWYIYVAVETKEGVEIDLKSLGNDINNISGSVHLMGEYESIRIVDNQEVKKKYTASVVPDFDFSFSFPIPNNNIDWADGNIHNTVIRYLGNVVIVRKPRENTPMYKKMGWRQIVEIKHLWDIKSSDARENFRFQYGNDLWYSWFHSTENQKSAYVRLEKAYADVYLMHKNNYDDLSIYALMHRNINFNSFHDITGLPSVLYFAHRKYEIPGYCDRILNTDSARSELLKLVLMFGPIYGPQFLCLSNSVLNLQKRVSIKKEFALDDILNYENCLDDSCDSYWNLDNFTEDESRKILDNKESILKELYNLYKLQIHLDARPDTCSNFIKNVSYDGIVNQNHFIRSRIDKWFKAYGYNSFADDLKNLEERRIEYLRKIAEKLNNVVSAIQADSKQLDINNITTEYEVKSKIDYWIRAAAPISVSFEIKEECYDIFSTPNRIEDLRKWIYEYEHNPSKRSLLSPDGYMSLMSRSDLSPLHRPTFNFNSRFNSWSNLPKEEMLRKLEEEGEKNRKKLAEVENAYPILKRELAELEKEESERKKIERELREKQRNQELEQRKREEGFISELKSLRAEVDKITDLALGMKIFEILADNLSSVNRYISDAYDRLRFLLKIRNLQRMDAMENRAEYIKSLIKSGGIWFRWRDLRANIMSYWCTALKNVEDKKRQEEIRLRKLREEQIRREEEIRLAKLRYNQNNVHPRDSRLSFSPDSHQYIVDGLTLQSVTDFVENCFPKFNAIEHAQKVAARSGKSPDEILKQWEEKGKESRDLGTVLHKKIENYYQGTPCVIDDAFSLFKIFADKYQLCAYRSEWAVYDTDYNIAGTIDFVDYQNGEFIIYDWKRSDKVIENGMPVKTSKYGEKGLPPIEHLDNCAYYHYALQLSMYKFILEKNYGMTIKDLRLGIFHPSYNKPYILKMPYLEQEINTLMELRSDVLF